MPNDLIILAVLAGFIAFAAVLTEKLSGLYPLKRELFGKTLHSTAMVLAGYSVYLIHSHTLLIIAAGAASVFLFYAVSSGLLGSSEDKYRKNRGIFFFPISFFFLLLFFYDYKWVIAVSLFIPAFAGFAAAAAETYIGIRLSADKKSIAGSSAFFIVSVITIYFSVNYFYGDSLQGGISGEEVRIYIFLSSLIISVLLTLTEALSSFGTDNFYVPVFASVLLLPIFRTVDYQLLASLLVGFGLAGIVSLISYRVKFLTSSGAAAAFLLAGAIFGFGGLKWSVPILSFFILSSLLSKFRKKSNAEVEQYFEKTGVRDKMQVIANGGLGGILVLMNSIAPNDLYYYLYLASLSAVCADTWATEIGTMRKAATYNIINLRPIEQGRSGGISFIGTLGAFLGAGIIAVSGIYWSNIPTAAYLPLIIFTGAAGAFFDSFLGATVQMEYKCAVCGKNTERTLHCGERSDYYKGFSWINNDFVNLLAGIFGIFLILFYYGFIK